jgi:NADPH-dependent curcumin reductase CurA
VIQPTEMPAYSHRPANRRVLLARRPHGVPQATDFSLDEAAIPEPGPNQFLVRNIYLSVDPAQRGWASAEASYSQPVPLGTPMRALAVGVVMRSNDPAVAEGEFLYGWFGWQDYAAVESSRIVARARDAVPLSAHAGLLGINGLTAYLGLTELARPVQGDTLLVSTAAGSVGSFVGQIGKLQGCRTIGLTGDDAKVARCRERFGYDEAFNYRTADLAQALADSAPGGLNVYFDNTGGGILDTALRRMAVGGRIVQCGTASNQVWTPPPTGPRNEREILTRRLVWSGFVVFDHVARFEEASRQLAKWYNQGLLAYDEDISDGIEHAPGAIAGLYAGKNQGKKLIYVG